MNTTKKIILLSYISVASASSAIITPALPVIEKTFRLNMGQLEYIVSIFLLGYMFGQLLYGPLANRFGRLKALRIGFVINLIGLFMSLISSYQNLYFLLVISRLITSIGAASGLCCTFTLVHELLCEKEAKDLLSYATLSFTLGIGLSIFIGGIITEYIHWNAVFWVLIIHGLIMLLSTWLFDETLVEKKEIHPKAIIRGFSLAVQKRNLIVFSLFYGISSVVAYCYSTMAPLIAHNFLQMNPAEYGLWSNILMLGMLLGSVSVAQLIKRYAVENILWVSLGLIALGIVSFYTQIILKLPSPTWFFITASYLYYATSWVFPCASYIALKHSPDKASSSSCMNFINMLSAVICVTIMGYIPLSHFSAMVSILSAYLIFTLCIYFLNKNRVKTALNEEDVK